MSADLHCPSCGERAIDVAEGYDPFAPFLVVSYANEAVALSCSQGHRWIEGYGRDGAEPGVRSKMLFGGER